MKIYHNHRVEPYFTYLKNGQKTIEGRLQKDWYIQVKAGDHIKVQNEKETDSIETEVIRVSRYTTIREMLQTEPLQRMLPGIANVDEGLKVYRQFYTEEQENTYGAIAIEIRRVK